MVTAYAPPTPPSFPSVTLAINLTGAFALGLVLTLIIEYWPPTRYARAFFGIGVLGGFTTFSTMVVEADRLIAADRAAVAFAYVACSLAGGIAACALGSFAARAWPRLVRPRRR